MAGKMNKLFGFLLLGLALVHCTTAQVDHTVGGTTQWSIPSSSSFYSTWAGSQTFTVGDTLTFTFDSTHDVAEVTKAGYDACDSSTIIGSANPNSPVTIPLSSPGPKYYICTYHCQSGQKLAITVVSAASSPPPTTAASPPPAPPTSASPPTATSVPPPSSDSPPSPPAPNADAPPPPTVSTTVPPPSPSSSQILVAAFSVTFWSVAVALFC